MRYVFLLIILLVSCKPTAIINRNAIREKTSTLKGAIDYQDFTVSIPKGWQIELDHGSPTYSSLKFGKEYYRNMTKIYNLNYKFDTSETLKKVSKKDYNQNTSSIGIYNINKFAYQTKFGDTYSYTFSYKINNTIYKTNRTYFAFNNSYYCMTYRSEKAFFDTYLDKAKAIMLSINTIE